jgi:hypothetical protein
MYLYIATQLSNFCSPNRSVSFLCQHHTKHCNKFTRTRTIHFESLPSHFSSNNCTFSLSFQLQAINFSWALLSPLSASSGRQRTSTVTGGGGEGQDRRRRKEGRSHRGKRERERATREIERESGEGEGRRALGDRECLTSRSGKANGVSFLNYSTYFFCSHYFS